MYGINILYMNTNVFIFCCKYLVHLFFIVISSGLFYKKIIMSVYFVFFYPAAHVAYVVFIVVK